jgi:hypothetical protein
VAVQRFVVTATTTVPAGTAATLTPGEPGTGAPAGPGNAAVASGPLWPVTFLKGTPIVLDTAGSLYAALNGAGALRPLTDADTVSHAALAN